MVFRGSFHPIIVRSYGPSKLGIIQDREGLKPIWNRLIYSSKYCDGKFIFFSFWYQGPPPDPTYNFLSDRSRASGPSDKISPANKGREQTRRHPKNFGGTDFTNVKPKMRAVKEKQVIFLRNLHKPKWMNKTKHIQKRKENKC